MDMAWLFLRTFARDLVFVTAEAHSDRHESLSLVVLSLSMEH